MKMVRSKLFAALLGLSVTVPMVAACSDCCPEAQAQPAVVSPAACCGECTPELGKPDAASSLAAKRVTSDTGWIPLAEEPVVQQLRILTAEPTQMASASRLLVPPTLPLPLRL